MLCTYCKDSSARSACRHRFPDAGFHHLDSDGNIYEAAFSLDGNGNGIYGPPENGLMYLADSLTGSGTIDGCTVRCISPQWMVRFHSGYELTKKVVNNS